MFALLRGADGMVGGSLYWSEYYGKPDTWDDRSNEMAGAPHPRAARSRPFERRNGHCSCRKSSYSPPLSQEQLLSVRHTFVISVSVRSERVAAGEGRAHQGTYFSSAQTRHHEACR